jgi:hypothetical protein
MFDSDDGLWKMWFSSLFTLACDAEVTDSDRTHIDIMYAESSDGLSWSVQPDPALTSHVNIGDWDYSTVETPTVIKVASNAADRRYMLLYAGANSEKYPDGGFILPRIAGSFAPWQLGLAFSADGHHFTRLPAAETPYVQTSLPFGNRDGLVFYAGYAFPTFPSVVYGSVADPEVVLIGDTYYLFFSSAGTDETGAVFQSGAEIAYGISTATSFDGISWTANAANPVIIGAGSRRCCRRTPALRCISASTLRKISRRRRSPASCFPRSASIAARRATASRGARRARESSRGIVRCRTRIWAC